MRDIIFSAPHLLPCACGEEGPCDGWMGAPGKMAFYVHCPACGEWVTGESEDEAGANWNATARAKRRAAK